MTDNSRIVRLKSVIDEQDLSNQDIYTLITYLCSKRPQRKRRMIGDQYTDTLVETTKTTIALEEYTDTEDIRNFLKNCKRINIETILKLG